MPIDPNPIQNAPSLLHAASLVGDTDYETEYNIRKMMAGRPPELYSSAKQLTLKALDGQGYDWAIRQAATILDEGKRKGAETVLPLMESYLRGIAPKWVRQLGLDPFQVDVDLQIPVRVAAAMRVDEQVRVLLLHLWQKRLTVRQLRAALTILHFQLRERADLGNPVLNLIDLSADPFGTRHFKLFGWSNVSLMSVEELDDFTGTLRSAWRQYKLNPVVKPAPPKKPEGQGDLF